MDILKLIIAWIFTAFTIFITFGMLIEGSLISAFLFFLLTLLIIPLNASQEYINYFLPRKWLKPFLCLTLFFAGALLFTSPEADKPTSEPEKIVRVQQEVEDNAEKISEPSLTTNTEIQGEKTEVVTSEVEPIEESAITDTNEPVPDPIDDAPIKHIEESAEQQSQKTYVLNTNSKKIHMPNCSSVDKMKESNKKVVNVNDISELLNQGYDPCSVCNPH